MGTPAENKATILEFLKALGAGDRDAARRAFAEDATWRYPASLGGPGVHRGREAIFDVYFAVDEKLYETGTREYDLEVTHAIAEGDSVAVEMRHRGRTRDGRPYATDYHVLYHLAEGRIREVHEYFDSLYVRRLYSDAELGVGASGLAARSEASGPARSPQGREAAAQRGEAERSVGPREGGKASEDRTGLPSEDRTG